LVNRIDLTFEINDGGYHAVDAELAGFNRVTTRAIVSCFDPDYFEFRLTGYSDRHPSED